MPNKTHQRNIEAREKARQALELRKAGLSYEAIAARVGWSAKSTAYHAIGKALDAITREPAKRVRSLELERLDALLLALWQKARGGDAGAIDRILKIMERRAKLLGLDAPQRVEQTLEHSGHVTNDSLSPKQIAERARELLRREFGVDAERAAGGLPEPTGNLGDAEPPDTATKDTDGTSGRIATK